MTRTVPALPRRDFLGRLLGAIAGGAWLARGQRAEAESLGSGEPYIGEILMFAGNFAPVGWMFCEGQILAISENEALFSLIGTQYGGDGVSTFALPDLRSRAPIHQGNGFLIAETGGAEDTTLVVNQIPAHSHAALASTAVGTTSDPTNNVPAINAAGVPQYGTVADVSLSSAALLAAGGSQPHNNMQPYLAIHFIISLYGIYPSPS